MQRSKSVIHIPANGGVRKFAILKKTTRTFMGNANIETAEINWKKNTALFLTGQALSLFGTMITQYAIFWHITLKSQSGSMMMIFSIAGFLPMFFISPFAGVWADRFNRKYIINSADGAIAFFSLVAAVFLVFGVDSYGLLLVCALVRSIGQGVQMPAVGAFIPQIVPEEHLTRINGFQSSIQSLATLASPMVSGALMTFAPLHTLFFVDVITAGIGIAIVFFFVKIPNSEKPESAIQMVSIEKHGNGYFHDLKEGLKYIKNHGYVLRMIILSAIFIFSFAPASMLTPLQVARKFGNDVWRLSANEITFSAGMMLGGVLIGLWGGFKNRMYTMALSCVLAGLLAVGLGVIPHFWLYLTVMGLLGVVMPMYNAPSMVLLQTRVEPAFMGRVMSAFNMVSSTMLPLGMAVFGPLADIVSIDTLLVITGTIAALLCIPMMASKILREAGKPDL